MDAQVMGSCANCEALAKRVEDLELGVKRAQAREEEACAIKLRYAKRIEELEHDLNGEVGFIGYRASAKVWEQRAEAAEAKLAEAKAHARIAFVEGAAWQNLQVTQATIWPSERKEAETEAERRYPGVDWPTHPQRVREAKAEVARLREALEGVTDAGLEFSDPRISYEVWQLNPGAMEQARAALRGEEKP